MIQSTYFRGFLCALVGGGATVALLLAAGILELPARQPAHDPDAALYGRTAAISEPPKSDEASPDWAIAHAGTWAASINTFGIVADFREMAISANFPLRIVTVSVELGQFVSRGTELATFEAPRLQEAISQLEAAHGEVTVAAAELERLKKLQQDGLATAPKVAAADVAFLKARQGEQLAWQSLRQMLAAFGQSPQKEMLIEELEREGSASVAARLSVVVAPFDGLVAVRGAMPGVVFTTGTILFAIEDVSRIYVDVGVRPERIRQWEQGSATVELLGQHVALQSTATVPRIDPTTGLMVIRYACELTEIVHMENARVPVTLQAAPQSVVWVPAGAIVARAAKTWCIVASDTGEPTAVSVKVGEATEDRVPILSGLAAGQRVLVNGAYEFLYRDLNQLLKFED